MTWENGPSAGTVRLTCLQRIAPPSLEWSINATTTYTFFPEHIVIQVKGATQGLNQPRTLPRIGLELTLSPDLNTATWYGRGPGESYKDKKLSQKFGKYSSAIRDLNFEYEFPQESGNRTETRWVEFTTDIDDDDDRSAGVKLKAEFLDKADGFDFQASYCDVRDVERARHPFELEPLAQKAAVVRLDVDHHGLGSGSCGEFHSTIKGAFIFSQFLRCSILTG